MNFLILKTKFSLTIQKEYINYHKKEGEKLKPVLDINIISGLGYKNLSDGSDIIGSEFFPNYDG